MGGYSQVKLIILYTRSTPFNLRWHKRRGSVLRWRRRLGCCNQLTIGNPMWRVKGNWFVRKGPRLSNLDMGLILINQIPYFTSPDENISVPWRARTSRWLYTVLYKWHLFSCGGAIFYRSSTYTISQKDATTTIIV